MTIALTNETRSASRTYWFVAVDGRPVARLCKMASGFRRWSVLKNGQWEQFASRCAAMAFATTGE